MFLIWVICQVYLKPCQALYSSAKRVNFLTQGTLDKRSLAGFILFSFLSSFYFFFFSSEGDGWTFFSIQKTYPNKVTFLLLYQKSNFPRIQIWCVCIMLHSNHWCSSDSSLPTQCPSSEFDICVFPASGNNACTSRVVTRGQTMQKANSALGFYNAQLKCIIRPTWNFILRLWEVKLNSF